MAHGAERELVDFYLAALEARPRRRARRGNYVQGLFDDYAAHFDAHLLGALHYRGHRVLVDTLAGRLRRRGAFGMRSISAAAPACAARC